MNGSLPRMGPGWRSRAVSIILLASFAVSCGTTPRSQVPTAPVVQKKKPDVRAGGVEKLIHRFINKERMKQGLKELSWNDRLSSIARSHSKDMGNRNYFSHDSPEGHDFSYRYRQAGYSCSIPVGNMIHEGAENIALNNLYDSVTTVNSRAFYDWNSGEKIAETTVRGWMNSPGHRKNIMTPHWKTEGIGVFIAPDDRIYITQNFC